MNVFTQYFKLGDSKVRSEDAEQAIENPKITGKSLRGPLAQIFSSPQWQDYYCIGLNSILTLYTLLFISFNQGLLFFSSFVSIIILLTKGPIYSNVTIFIIEYCFFLYIKTEIPLETMSFLLPMIFIYNSLPIRFPNLAVIGLFLAPSLIFFDNFIKIVTELMIIRLLLKIKENKSEEVCKLVIENESIRSLDESTESFEPLTSDYEKILWKLEKSSDSLKKMMGLNKDNEKALSLLAEVSYLLETTPNIYSVTL